jgi:hypothetical protein
MKQALQISIAIWLAILCLALAAAHWFGHIF